MTAAESLRIYQDVTIDKPNPLEVMRVTDAIVDTDSKVALGEITIRTADKAYETMWGRNGTDDPNKSHQSLMAYDPFKSHAYNPAEGDTAVRTREEIRNMVAIASADMDRTDIESMSMLLPNLVKTQVLDAHSIDKIYETDITAPTDIALDWFKNPELVDQTHIRIGFGGEQYVNSRIPAYALAAIRTVREVKHAFAQQQNWAMKEELQKRRAGENADERGKIAEQISTWIGQALIEKIQQKGAYEAFSADLDAEQEKKRERRKKREEKEKKKNKNMANEGTDEPDSAADSADAEQEGKAEEITEVKYVQAELKNMKYLTAFETREVLEEAWAQFADQDVPYEYLQKQYHFSDKAPTIVFFNAANAAIEINGMDPEKVAETTQQTQQYIFEFIRQFHPDVLEHVVFQNDLPWSSHTDYTDLWAAYANYAIHKDDKASGVGKRFDKNAQNRHTYNEKIVKGMAGPEAYASLHPGFFKGVVEADDPEEQIPDPRYMAAMPKPRNIIFHQGESEREFTVYRMAYAKNASLTDMIQWLETQQIAAQYHEEKPFSKVWETANRLKKNADVRGFVAIAQKELGIAPHVREVITVFTNSAEFNEACKNGQAEQAWKAFASSLEEFTQATPEVLRNAKRIENVRKSLEAHQKTVQEYRANVSFAAQEQDKQPQIELASHRLAMVGYTRQEGKLTVKGAKHTVYYAAPGDVKVWPQRETAGINNYDVYLKAAQQKADRLAKTIPFIDNKIMPSILGVDVWVDDMESIDAQDALEAFWKVNISEEILQQWTQEDNDKLKEIYYKIDKMEAEGNSADVVTQALIADLTQWKQNRVDSLIAAGISEKNAPRYANQTLWYAKSQARAEVISETKAEIAPIQNARADFLQILADIHPNIIPLQQARAQARYELRMNENVLTKKKLPDTDKKNAQQIVTELKEKLPAIEEALVQAQQEAEDIFNTFLERTFPAPTNGAKHENEVYKTVTVTAANIVHAF